MNRLIRTTFVASLLAFGLMLLSSQRVAESAKGTHSGTNFGEPGRVADAK